MNSQNSKNIFNKLLKIQTWQLLLLVIIASEVLTAVITTANSLILWSRIDGDLLLIGAVDALVVSSIVGGLVMVLLHVIRKREVEIRMQKEKSESILEGIGEAISIVDRDFVIHYQNEHHMKVHGDVRGRHCYEGIHGMSTVCDACPVDEGFNDGKVHTVTKRKVIKGETRVFENTASPLRDAAGNITSAVEMIRDITDRKRIEEKVRQSERDLKRAQAIAQMGSWSWDIATNDVTWTGEIYKIYGYDPETFSPDYKTVTDAMSPESLEPFLKAIDGALKGNEPFEMDYSLIRTDGEARTIHTKGEVVFDEDGKPLKMFGTVYDITDRKRYEEEMTKIAVITEQTAEGIASATLDGIITYANKAWASMHGYSSGELVGKHLKMFHTEEQLHAEVLPFIERVKTMGHYSGEVGHKRRDGATFPTYMTVTLLKDKNGVPYGTTGFATDITKQKRIEEKVKTSLKEKDILLREIHHRVKNNLAIISGFLRMQSRFVENEEARSVLMESQNRIKAMALIHEKLYMDHDLLCIDCRDYIQSLLVDLISSYSVGEKGVECETNVDDVSLNIDTMIPFGMIISELVTNSLKYAANGETSRISIRLKAEDEKYVFRIKDNGPGIPADVDVHNSRGLGLQIVTGLVTQLNGIMELDNTEGAGFTITFGQMETTHE